MTDATGKSFLSYRSTRRDEAALLIAAQHDHGIPTWQDRNDLEQTPTGDEIRRVLEDPQTANALLWITPDVKDSNVIRKIEVPCILKRVNAKDEFFLVPACAGGLDYQSAAEAVDQQISADNLEDWNLLKISANPIEINDAAEVAHRVLKRRLSAIDRQLNQGEPLKLVLHTRTRSPFQLGAALSIDWSPRFSGREASVGVWKSNLLPALAHVSDAVRINGGGRTVIASGLAALPAATALGAAFLAQRGQKLHWSQYTQDRGEQLWSLDFGREATEFEADTRERDVSASDLAVLVSVTENVEPSFAQTPKDTLPNFRAILRISNKGSARFDITSAGQANDIALKVIDAIRAARQVYRPMGVVHLFMAVPVGLAMLIGQLLNTFGQVQTYEHIPTDATGVYRPAAILFPSS